MHGVTMKFKEKLSLYKPGKALTATGHWNVQNFYAVSTWKFQGCQPYAPATFTPQIISSALISVKRLSRPQNHYAAARIKSLIPLAIKPTTLMLVAQYLNQLGYAYPISPSVNVNYLRPQP